MNQIPLSTLVQARDALRQIKDAPGDSVPTHLWKAAMQAHARLNCDLEILLQAHKVEATGTPK